MDKMNNYKSRFRQSDRYTDTTKKSLLCSYIDNNSECILSNKRYLNLHKILR